MSQFHHRLVLHIPFHNQSLLHYSLSNLNHSDIMDTTESKTFKYSAEDEKKIFKQRRELSRYFPSNVFPPEVLPPDYFPPGSDFGSRLESENSFAGNRYLPSNPNAGSSTAASHGNVATPSTGFSQSGAPDTSQRPGRTPSSRLRSDGSVSAGSGVGPSVAERRTYQTAKRARSVHLLSNDDRPASRSSPGRSSDEVSEGQRAREGSSGSQGTKDRGEVIRGTGTYHKYSWQEVPHEEPSGIQEGRKGRRLRNRVVD